MNTIAYILALLMWPAVFFPSQILFALSAAPLFLLAISLRRQKPSQPPDFLLADLFQAISSGASQLLIVFLAAALLKAFNLTVPCWLLVVYGLLAGGLTLYPSQWGEAGRRADASGGFGQLVGLIAGTALFVTGEGRDPALSLFFWASVVIVAWFGVRELMTMASGLTQDGPVKPGQSVCHAISLLIYWAACFAAVYYGTFWPLIVGLVLVALWRRAVIASGESYGAPGPPAPVPEELPPEVAIPVDRISAAVRKAAEEKPRARGIPEAEREVSTKE